MPRADLSGLSLAYEPHGAGATPVVLLGGLGMPAGMWNRVGTVGALTGAGYRAIACDARGVGDSDAPPGPYTIEQMAGDIADLVSALQLAPAHVVGASQGGFIAEALAQHHPELLRTATLIASAGPTTAYTRAWAQAWRDLLAAVPEPPASMLALDELLGLPPQLLRDDDATTADWAELLLSQSAATPAVLAQSAACQQWLLDRDHAAARPSISTRCLVMSFEHDLRWPPRGGRQAAEGLPDAEFVQIPGVGHTEGLFEAAGRINDALVGFLTVSDAATDPAAEPDQTTSAALRAATSTGSHTGANGGA